MLAGVMGWPVAHSRSPLIHNHWLQELAIPGSYVLLPVAPERLGDALRALPALGFAGCNLTIPHKVAALAFVDAVDPLARRIGAINTVVVQSDGQLVGRNTDAFGYVRSIYDTRPEWKAREKPCVVVGAGGAARAIIAGLVDEGATEIRLTNRSMDKAITLRDEFGPVVQPVSWEGRHACLDGAGLIVNTTNQGMQGQPALELSLNSLPQDALVSDIVYTPLRTPLLLQAAARGNPTVDGLGMLVNQARLAFEAWTGVMPQYSGALRTRLEVTL